MAEREDPRRIAADILIALIQNSTEGAYNADTAIRVFKEIYAAITEKKENKEIAEADYVAFDNE